MARTCPFGICDGSGFVVDEVTRTSSYCRCREQLVAAARAKSLSAVIPKHYANASFERYPDLPMRSAVEARAYVRRLDEHLDQGRGLWLFGPPGTGKTTLAMIVSRTALARQRSVAIYSLPRLLSEIRRTFDDGSPITQTQLIDQLAAVDLLHIDDVGAEQTSPWVLEQLYAIVNTRYEAEKSILITTNLKEDELAEQIGARTVSRLRETCEIIPVFGPDLRRTEVGIADDLPPLESPVRWDVA